jgi:hypothetical protein
MRHSIYLAWRYLQLHKGKMAVLVAVLTLITYLPLAVRMLVHGSAAPMLARAINPSGHWPEGE